MANIVLFLHTLFTFFPSHAQTHRHTPLAQNPLPYIYKTQRQPMARSLALCHSDRQPRSPCHSHTHNELHLNPPEETWSVCLVSSHKKGTWLCSNTVDTFKGAHTHTHALIHESLDTLRQTSCCKSQPFLLLHTRAHTHTPLELCVNNKQQVNMRAAMDWSDLSLLISPTSHSY